MANNRTGLRPVPDNQTAEKSSNNYWWIILLAGALSVIAGIVILAIDWTIPLLAFFLGAVFIARGILHIFSPSYANYGRGWNISIGILSVIVGAAILVFPLFATLSLLVLASFIGIWFIAWGISHIAAAISNRRSTAYWGLMVIGGILSTVLGIAALYEPVLTLDVAIAIAGIWSIVVGTIEIGIALEFRRLPDIILDAAVEGMPLNVAQAIERMAMLRDQGIITDEEFEEFKRRRIA